MELPLSLHEIQGESTFKNPKEKALPLETQGQRILEASLFIDKKFVDVAAIAGLETPIEKLFGEEEWKGYIDARKYSLKYGDQDLTIEFIQKIHEKLTAEAKSQIAGKIRNVPGMAGDYNDPHTPVAYTPDEILNIKSNPYLKFDDKGDGKGFILYPSSIDTQKTVTDLLAEVCNWYNAERKKPDADPHKLAALLQRKLISIHPFFDSNGGTSRIVMNWSLQNHGVAPSILENPSNDILVGEDQWVNEVKKGSERYANSKVKLEALEKAGIEDNAYFLGMGAEKAFYDYIYKYIAQIPKLTTADGMLDHKNFEAFFREFVTELRKFQKFLQTTTQIGGKTVSQGGFISNAFIKGFAGPASPENVFFSNINVFRGVSLDIQDLNDQKILELVTSPTGVSTGYRALEMSDMSPLSGNTVNSDKIKETMDYYNKMIAKLYFAKTHPDKTPYSAGVGNLEQIINSHVAGGKDVTVSPFVSTSFSYNVSQGWVSRMPNVKYGALFVSSVPREGVVLSFGLKDSAMASDISGITSHLGFASEKECLIAGGLDPNSISEVRIFKNKKPAFIARKLVHNGDTQIDIYDITGEFAVLKRYTFDRASKGFKLLTGAAQTTIRSSELVAQRPEEEHVSVYEPYSKYSKENPWPPKKSDLFDIGYGKIKEDYFQIGPQKEYINLINFEKDDFGKKIYFKDKYFKKNPKEYKFKDLISKDKYSEKIYPKKY